MKIKLQNICVTLITLVILFVPLFNWEVYSSILEGRSIRQSSGTPIAIKLIKDILIVLFLIVMIIRFLTGRLHMRTPSLIAFFLVLSVLILSILNSAHEANLYQIFAGLRWAIWFFVLILIIELDFCKYQVNRFVKIVAAIFFSQLLLQALQFSILPPSFGTTHYGLSLRNAGFFVSPKTCGLFAVAAYLMLYYFSYINRALVFFASVLSILLTASGLAFGVFCIILTYQVLSRRFSFGVKTIIAFFTLLGSSPILISLFSFSGRSIDKVIQSASGRIDSLHLALDHVQIFSQTFGLGTSTYRSLSSTFSEGGVRSWDSGYISVLLNFGVLGFIAIISPLLLYLIYQSKKQNEPAVIAVGFVLVVFTSYILPEAYPINIMVALVISFSGRGKLSHLADVEDIGIRRAT